MKIDILSQVLPQRADLLVKYMYIDAYLQGGDMTYMDHIYKQHIRLYATNLESHKQDLDGYIKSFKTLIDSVKKNGFSSKYPVSYKKEKGIVYIYDGIHRLACCLYFGIEPVYKEVDISESPTWDIGWFLQEGFSQKDILAIVFTWLKIDTNILPIVLWNTLDLEKSRTIFEKHNIDIYNYVSLSFSRKDFYELITDVYHFETDSDKLSAVDEKILKLLKTGPSFTLLFGKIQNDDIDSHVLKQEIRTKMLEVFSLPQEQYYYTFHYPDTEDERNYMKEILHPENIRLLSLRSGKYPNDFMKNMSLLRGIMFDKQIDPNTICVVKSGPMSIFGLHSSFDVDIVFENYNGKGVLKLQDGTNTVEVLDYQYHQDISNKDIIYKRENHFWFRGIKFLILPLLLEVKGYDGGCKKDFDHASIIKKFLKENQSPESSFKSFFTNVFVELRLLKRKTQLGTLHVLGYISSKLGIYDQMFHIWTHYIKKRK